MKRHLIVYAKRPLPGYAKTRLGVSIGTEQSAGVYARLLYAYLLDLLGADLADIAVELSVASPADVPFFADAFSEWTVRPQVQGDLGQRMAASFARAFAWGAERVVLTGSDIPGLGSQLVRSAFEMLDAAPLVLGPATDGGYYLIGMRAPGASLFEGIAWSSEHVLAQTVALAQAQGLAVVYLPERSDVDTEADLERWQRTLCADTKESSNVKKPSEHRKWIHIPLVIAIFGTLAATAWYYFSMYDSFNRQNLEAFIRGFGPWAPLAYAAIYVISSPIPFIAPIISAVGGLLFGTLWGTLLVLVVATASAFVPFTLARRLGREWVESKLQGKKLGEIYQQSGGSKGFAFIMLMRLIPVLPWEVQNYVAGLTRVSALVFVLGTIVGIIPGSFSLVFLGAFATDPTSWQFFVAIALKVVTALIPVVAIYIRNRRGKRKEQVTG